MGPAIAETTTPHRLHRIPTFAAQITEPPIKTPAGQVMPPDRLRFSKPQTVVEGPTAEAGAIAAAEAAAEAEAMAEQAKLQEEIAKRTENWMIAGMGGFSASVAAGKFMQYVAQGNPVPGPAKLASLAAGVGAGYLLLNRFEDPGHRQKAMSTVSMAFMGLMTPGIVHQATKLAGMSGKLGIRLGFNKLLLTKLLPIIGIAVGASGLYKKSKNLSSADNHRKWDDYIRMTGDGVQVVGGIGAFVPPVGLAAGLIAQTVGMGISWVGDMFNDQSPKKPQ